jgi:uncharacterized protein involved in high-affinity Fe2+ transport
MRSRWAAFPVAAVLACAQARAAVIGGPLLRDGLEVVPSTWSGVELDRVLPLAKAPDSILLVADIRAAKDEPHGFIGFVPYLSVSYLLTKEDAPTFKRDGLLYPLAAKDGPRYGAPTELAGPGVYHLTYIISPPSSHGMMRRTDKEDGVPDWWKPITASWIFSYPTSAK